MAITEAPKIVTARLGYEDSHTLERYLATGGYDGLRKALTMTPEAVAHEVDTASLLGRGGAGFPAGRKWAMLRKDPVTYLVVDDSVFARKNLARIIESYGGHLAGEAADGVAAIEEFDRTLADIVLMDITMPQMEGIEAAERIVRQHPEARVIMVSSVGYQENIVAALQKGARHFVQKPVKPELLYEVIKYVLGDAAVTAPATGE